MAGDAIENGVGMRRVVSAVALLLIAPLALAQTTRTYSYDALGRLVKVTPNSGTPVCYSFDAADNRTAVSASATCPSSGSNSPPVAVNDYIFRVFAGATFTGNVSVLGNDTDPNLPNDTLTIISVTGDDPYATIAPGGTQVRMIAAPAGIHPFQYTIRDAAGATSSAYVELELCSGGGGSCS